MLQKGYLVVSQSEEGEYKIDINARLKGGGAGGAAFGFFLGQVLVWGACHTVAGVAGAFGTPLAGVAAETAISASSPFIAAIALKVSLGLGVFFGAATGPI